MLADTTVIISVYSGTNPHNLKDCLESIKRQENCQFYVLIVMDGLVSPEIKDVLREFTTFKELNVVEIVENQGLALALNYGLKEIKTKYVTRIDCDDTMRSDRLSVQLQYLRDHPEVSAVGSYVNVINPVNHSLIRKRVVPEKPETALSSKYLTPMNHPSVTFRLSDVISVGGYPNFRKAQDRALWCTLMQNGYILRNQKQYLTTMKHSGKKARAWSYLWYEIQVANYLYSIKFLTLFQFIANVVLLSCHRTCNEILIRLKL